MNRGQLQFRPGVASSIVMQSELSLVKRKAEWVWRIIAAVLSITIQIKHLSCNINPKGNPVTNL